MSPSAIEKSGELLQVGVGGADLDVRLVGKPLRGRTIHADSAQHAGREVVGTVDPQGVLGQLHDRRLEVRGVVLGAGPIRGGGEVVDQCGGGVKAPRCRAHGPQVGLPCRAGRPGEHRRGDRRKLRERLRGQGLRAQDQVGRGGLDAGQVGRAAGAHRRQVMHDRAEIRRLAGRAVGQRGGDDAGLQTERAQGVELVAGEHHDALRIGGHLGVTGGVADPAGRTGPGRAAPAPVRRIRRACADCPARPRRRSWWCW